VRKNNAILLLSCPDQKGIIAEVCNFIFRQNGNIEHSDNHLDEQKGIFFMRVEWSLEGFGIPGEKIKEAFSSLADKFRMDYQLYFTTEPIRIAIYVSRHEHCLYNLLLGYKAGELHAEIPLIVSNHPDLKQVADYFKIPYHHFPVTTENKEEQERKQLALLKQHGVELVVLARYMQILTPQFVNAFSNRIINVHHSFLPAFKGAKAHEQAYASGVKVIGATSHYAVEKLDAGPIIEQDVVKVSHRDTLRDFIRKGKDLEKSVLRRAVYLHLERKILVYDNKTVIFD